MTDVDVAERLEKLIAPTIEAMGFSIVRVMLMGSENPILQIMTEPHNGGPMLVADCARISRAVSAVLDVEDPISGAYTLEVSSPGIDRPLVRLGDFDRFAGHEVKIELRAARDGQRRFRGKLGGTNGEDVMITVNGDPVALAHADIARAKLVVTDDMIAALEKEKTS